MTTTIYTVHNTPNALFAEKNDKWFSVKGQTISLLAQRPACSLDPVNLATFPRLRWIDAAIDKMEG